MPHYGPVMLEARWLSYRTMQSVPNGLASSYTGSQRYEGWKEDGRLATISSGAKTRPASTAAAEAMSTADGLPEAARRLALLLAAEPAAELRCELPVPPGINDWWEPVSIRRKGQSVASLRLTRAAKGYKTHAEEVLMRAGVDLVALEDEFRDLWLQIHVTSYLATPLERDSDGPLKPLQDLLCALLCVDDARVRYTGGSLLLDAARPRVAVRIEGYQVWDASGLGGPFYLLRTKDTPAGRRSEPLPLTVRRLPEPRPHLRALLEKHNVDSTASARMT